MHGFFRELRALDHHLDVFFLPFPLLDIAPPARPLVFAGEPEMLARPAERLALVTLLAAEPTGKAS